MIKVSQAGISRPAIFDPGGPGPLETQNAVEHFTADPPRTVKFEFDAYGHRTVKEALTALFRGKCAYCEGRFDATQPVDVEHWRPKGDVEEEVEQIVGGKKQIRRSKLGRGYYWLAATWENLLPSCIDCNRRRTHTIHTTGEERVIGKGNFFPLQPGCTRATRQGEEAAEQPLLLNPYHDDLATAFRLGKEGELHPETQDDGKPDPRALASIQVYALNRTGLVMARQQLLYEMEQHMYVVRELAKLLNEPLAPAVEDAVRDLMHHEMEVLQGYGDPGRPYSFCADLALRRFEEEMGLPPRP
jgi:hypothetical protein